MNFIISSFQRLASAKFKEEKKKCFNRILSISNELSAIQLLLEFLREIVRTRETSTEMDENLLHEMNYQKPQEKNVSDSSYDSDHKDAEHVDYVDLKEKGVEEDDLWKMQCAVIYRLTRKYIIDKNILKLVDLETFYNKKLKRYSADKVMAGSMLESEIDHVSSQSSQHTKQITSRTVDDLCIDMDGLNFSFSKKSLSGPESSCDKKEVATGDSQVAVLDRAIFEFNEPAKMTNLQRELAISKYEVELYILEANSHKLAVEIIPNSELF